MNAGLTGSAAATGADAIAGAGAGAAVAGAGVAFTTLVPGSSLNAYRPAAECEVVQATGDVRSASSAEIFRACPFMFDLRAKHSALVSSFCRHSGRWNVPKITSRRPMPVIGRVEGGT
ncbi:MAG: hypothetical protein GC162_11355 [Planctomycetes bacterium]|nr:hypothetical protein [Planctomycetota bacterium]